MRAMPEARRPPRGVLGQGLVAGATVGTALAGRPLAAGRAGLLGGCRGACGGAGGRLRRPDIRVPGRCCCSAALGVRCAEVPPARGSRAAWTRGGTVDAGIAGGLDATGAPEIAAASRVHDGQADGSQGPHSWATGAGASAGAGLVRRMGQRVTRGGLWAVTSRHRPPVQGAAGGSLAACTRERSPVAEGTGLPAALSGGAGSSALRAGGRLSTPVHPASRPATVQTAGGRGSSARRRRGRMHAGCGCLSTFAGAGPGRTSAPLGCCQRRVAPLALPVGGLLAVPCRAGACEGLAGRFVTRAPRLAGVWRTQGRAGSPHAGAPWLRPPPLGSLRQPLPTAPPTLVLVVALVQRRPTRTRRRPWLLRWQTRTASSALVSPPEAVGCCGRRRWASSRWQPVTQGRGGDCCQTA